MTVSSCNLVVDPLDIQNRILFNMPACIPPCYHDDALEYIMARAPLKLVVQEYKLGVIKWKQVTDTDEVPFFHPQMSSAGSNKKTMRLQNLFDGSYLAYVKIHKGHRNSIAADRQFAQGVAIQKALHAEAPHLFPAVVYIYEKARSYSTGQTTTRVLMEHAPNGDLEDYIKKFKDFPRLKWTQQMLSILTILQRQGLVHRDIKPANYLIDKERNLKLADFDDVRNEKECTSRGGTSKYYPPEYIREKGKVFTRYHSEIVASHKADVYATGCILKQLWEKEASIQELIAGMMNPDPTMRWDGKRAFQWYVTHKEQLRKHQLISVI